MVPGVTGEITKYRGVTGTPRGVNGPSWALVEKGGQQGGCGERPPRPKPNWFGARGRPPPSFSSPSFFPCWTRKGGVLLLVGVGLPPLAAPYGLGRRPPPPSFIY